MTDFRKCPHCGRDSARDSMGRAMKLCGSVECNRKAAAVRSRRAREKRKNPPVAPLPVGSAVDAPWGQQYRCLCLAWVEAALLSGFRFDRTEAVEWIEAQGYDGHGPLDCAAAKDAA